MIATLRFDLSDPDYAIAAEVFDEAANLIERLRNEVARQRLTGAEREAIELAAGDYLYHQDAGGRAQWIRTTLLGLLERLG